MVKKQTEDHVHESAEKMRESASELLHEGKKLASELYQDGVSKVSQKVGLAEDTVHEYSDQLVEKSAQTQ